MSRRLVWVSLVALALVAALVGADALAGGKKEAFALREKCARGDLPSCAKGAMFYVRGEGVNWDLAEAEHMAKKACEGGDTLGCVNLARISMIGYSVEDKDVHDAAVTLKKACDAKDVDGCIALGWLHVRDEAPVGEQPPTAFLDEQCTAGNGAACLVSGALAEGDAAKALGLFQKSCDAGYADGCSRLGAAYEKGEGAAADPAKAKSLYDQACKAGSMDGCARLAHAYEKGVGVPASASKADGVIAKLCGGEQARLCYGHGLILKDGGLEGPENPDGMLELFDFACRGGYTWACYRLGTHLDRGDALPRDRAAAAKQYQVACDKNLEEACTDLGVLYHFGWGVPYDDAKAMELWKKSCVDHRDPLGCLWYGRAYRDGVGIAQDDAQAFTYLNRACNAGLGTGCEELGALFAAGRGTKVDNEMAATMYRRACMDDVGEACATMALHSAATSVDPKIAAVQSACDNGGWATCVGLGQLTASGLAGLPKDGAKAVELYERACDREDAWGCKQAARAYMNACGVPQDASKAAAAAKKGCDAGDEGACWMAERAGAGAPAAAPATGASSGTAELTADRLKLMCEDGIMDACGTLGDRLLTGQGAEKDAAAGQRLLEEACRHDEETACATLGERWLDGTLGSDAPKGLALLERACAGAYDACPGSTWPSASFRGCRVLGEAYVGGKWGITKDEAKGKSYLDRACTGGDAAACEQLAALTPPPPPPAPEPPPAAPKKKGGK
jgi:TPR repeat protein